MREPKRLRRRPHWRGMPIPANVVIGHDGVPDFSAIATYLTKALVVKRACMLCGEKMRGEVAFIGGENAIAMAAFYDGPMHKECARYAFVACPFVSGVHRSYREPKEHPDHVLIKKAVTTAKRMGMLMARNWELVEHQGSLVFVVSPEDRISVAWEDEIKRSLSDGGGDSQAG